MQKLLEPEGWIDWIILLVDMIVQPLIVFISWAIGYETSKLSMAGTLIRAAELWWKWMEYQVLRDSARHWILITKLMGGPFISCNDPAYHVFVYAEAIERLRLLGSGLGLPHKRLPRVPASKERLEAGKHL